MNTILPPRMKRFEEAEHRMEVGVDEEKKITVEIGTRRKLQSCKDT